MANRFNLMELLNQRSREQEAAAGEQEEAAKVEQAAAGPEKGDAGQQAEEIKMIDVFDLIPSKDNFYRVDDDLKRSIELVGVLQPLLVKRPENGKYRVIAGHRRRLAVLSLIDEGKEERRYMPCVFKKEDLKDRLAIIMANRFRDKTDWEKMMEAIEAENLARDLKRELQLPGRTREVLAEITGVTEAQLGRYKAIYNNLTPQLMAEFKADNINVSVASELSGLSEEWQERAERKLEEAGTLTLPDVKELKRGEEESRGIPGQMSMADAMQPEEEPEEPEEAEEETAEEMEEPEEAEEPAEEWEDPQPETIISLCYSCDKYETCHEKKSTVRDCNAYVNREEARKTPQQRYDEEQAKIDRETKKKLQEQQQEAAAAARQQEEPKEHDIRLSGERYDELASGKLTFLLLKKDGYKLGERLTMPEYAGGKPTHRNVYAEITYIWEDWTGLEDDFCIIGLSVKDFD